LRRELHQVHKDGLEALGDALVWGSKQIRVSKIGVTPHLVRA
jgi:hypothetical protein